jgi:beta-lactamase superfamily II metal-dependent hydrolase
MVSRIQCLAVDLVVAPHHGSATSSSVALVKATSPAKVIFAAGHGNRWRFPADSVVDRWKSVGASGLVTGEIGAVTVRFSTSGQARFWLERLRHQRLWRARPVSSGSDVQYDSGSFPTRDVRNTCSKLSDPADG